MVQGGCCWRDHLHLHFPIKREQRPAIVKSSTNHHYGNQEEVVVLSGRLTLKISVMQHSSQLSLGSAVILSHLQS